jgi:hypothetical protein
MAKLETVLVELEDRLIVDRLAEAWVPIGKVGLERFLAAWEKIFDDPSKPVPKEELHLERLTPEERGFIQPVIDAYAATEIWGNLPTQRKKKIVELLKKAR